MRAETKWFRIERLWTLLPFVAVLSFGLRQSAPPLDFWWHLKAGQVIWESGAIPRTDLFSFTAEGQPFILQNWLAVLIYYGIHRLGDLELLIVFNTLLLAAALVPVYFLCRSATPSLRWAAWGTTAAALYLISFSVIRPQAFSIFLFALFAFILRCDRLNRTLWMLPLLMLAWVNLHGAFPLGLALVGLVLAYRTAQALSTPEAETRTRRFRAAGKLLLCMGLCALATLANPEGFQVWEYVRTVAGDEASRSFVTEWQPPGIASLRGSLLLYLPVFGVLGCLGAGRLRGCRLDLLLFIAFAALAASATRNLIWFGLVAAPLYARLGSALPWWSLLPAHWLLLRDSTTPAPRASNPILGTAVLLGFLVATVPMLPWLRPFLKSQPRDQVLLHHEIAAAAVEFMREHRLAGRIFNDQKFGDYLIWRLWPHQKTFIDGRVHLFGRKLVEDYILIPRDSCWESRLAEYGIRYLLVRPESELARKARNTGRWRTLFEDERSILMERMNGSP